jgi:hypothetical protein
VRELLGVHAPASHLLDAIVADGRRGVQARLDVA